MPGEGALRIQLQGHLGQTVIVDPLAGAAAYVAEHFARFLQGEAHPVAGEKRAQTPHVAQEIAAPRYAGRNPKGPPWDWPCANASGSVGTETGGGAAEADPNQRGVAMGRFVTSARRLRPARKSSFSPTKTNR